MMRERAKAVLWWGIVLMVVGAVDVAFAPNLMVLLMHPDSAQQGVNALANGVSILVQLAAQILLPLGAALIGASIVLFALRQHAGDPAEPEDGADVPADRYRA